MKRPCLKLLSAFWKKTDQLFAFNRKETISKLILNLFRILKYSEAEYSPPAYITEMEKEGKQGDIILVSGIRTGAAVVKVRIYESFYKVKSLCYKLSFTSLAYIK